MKLKTEILQFTFIHDDFQPESQVSVSSPDLFATRAPVRVPGGQFRPIKFQDFRPARASSSFRLKFQHGEACAKFLLKIHENRMTETIYWFELYVENYLNALRTYRI